MMQKNMYREMAEELLSGGAPEVDMERVKARTEARLAEAPAAVRLAEGRSVKRGLRTLLLAAALCAATVVSFAAVNHALDGRLAALLGIGESQSEQLAPASAALGMAETHNGAAIAVKGTIGDQKTLYILVDITAPEGYSMLEKCPERVDITIDGSPCSTSWGWTLLDDGDPADNAASYLVDINLKGKSLIGSNIGLVISNIGSYLPGQPEGEPEFHSDIEGEWSFGWELEYSNLSRTVKPNRAVLVEGREYTVKSIVYSPLSATIMLETNGAPADAMQDKLADLAEDISFTIDGKAFRPEQGGSYSSTDNGTALEYTVQFRQVVEPDKLESITVFGVEIPLQ